MVHRRMFTFRLLLRGENRRRFRQLGIPGFHAHGNAPDTVPGRCGTPDRHSYRRDQRNRYSLKDDCWQVFSAEMAYYVKPYRLGKVFSTGPQIGHPKICQNNLKNWTYRSKSKSLTCQETASGKRGEVLSKWTIIFTILPELPS